MSTTQSLWLNDNGAISCEDHAGQYLRSAINQRPRAKTHRTPLGTWDKLTQGETQALTIECGVLCESCRAHQGSTKGIN